MKQSPRPPKKIVAITGSHSFFGRNLVHHLAQDKDVGAIVGFDLDSEENPPPKFRFVHLDMTRPEAKAELRDNFQRYGVNTVAHLAFLNHPTHSSQWRGELEKGGTENTLEACQAAGIRKIVVVSSTMLYGSHPDNPAYLTEEDPLRGIDHSAFIQDRIDVETQLANFAQSHRNCLVTVLRAAPILGPTADNVWIRYFKRKRVVKLMGMDPLLQFLDERDALRALHQAVCEDHPGIYNIVGPSVLSLSRVIRKIGRQSISLPSPLAQRLVGTFWRGQLLNYTPPTFLRYLRYPCLADGARAREEMNFIPSYSLAETLTNFARALHR